MVTNEVSASTFYRGYLRYLREHGWGVTIIASSNGTLKRLGDREGVATYDLQMRRDPSPFDDVRSLLRAIFLIARLRPEMVVAATPKAGLLGMLAAWITRVPVRVYQLWGLRLESESGLRRMLFLFLEKLASGLATQVIANSSSLARETERLKIAKRVAVLGPGSSHGVDIDHFSANSVDIPGLDSRSSAFFERRGKHPTVGFVGRVHRHKGIGTLLDAVEMVALRGTGLNLLIVGPGEDSDIEQRLEALRVPGLEVHHVGMAQDTRPYFLLMDIHCLPTLREGFPNVVLEASSMAIPSITTRATGARDSVLPGLTGILVDPENVEQLAHAIEALISDIALREEMGANARAHIVENFRSSAIFALQENNLRIQRDQSVRINGSKQLRTATRSEL